MKPFFVLFFVLACWQKTSIAQTDTTGHKTKTVYKSDTTDLAKDFPRVEIESEFPGGTRAWLQFLNTQMKYPQKAIRRNIQGTVVLQFIVDRDGSIYDLRVISGDPILGEAALDVMKNSPKWSPAVQRGRAVKSYKKQPIIFRLE